MKGQSKNSGEGFIKSPMSTDDERILILLKAAREAPDEYMRTKLHNEVFNILQNSPEGYMAKSKSRFSSILRGPFSRVSVGVESLYRETVAVFMRSIEDGKFRGESSLSTFLCGISIIIARNELRKTKHYLEKIARAHDFPELKAEDEPVESDSHFDQINKALNNMEDQESVKILRLFYFEELTDRDIAKNMGYDGKYLDTETERIKKKRQRALQKLRSQFSKQE